MSIPTGLSSSKLASYKQEAAKVIARFDTNKDGQLDRTEADRQVFLNRDSYSFTNRISHDYVTRTTVTQEHSAVVKAGAFERVDADRDGKISADEMVGTYLTEQDNNKDGNLSWWERLWMGGASSMVSAVQGRVSREVDRTSRLEYNPEVDYDRPTPPSPDRPTPPSPDRPTPPSPYRPTPPSPYRPTPPSPGGSDRPTPPSPSSDRPAPPSPSGSRPTPPRP